MTGFLMELHQFYNSNMVIREEIVMITPTSHWLQGNVTSFTVSHLSQDKKGHSEWK